MMIKRLNLAEILAQLLVALLLFALIALQSVSAQTTCSSDDIDQDDNDLIDICDLEDLNAIRDNPDGAGTMEQGCSSTCTGFELMGDLDFNSTSSYSSGNINTAWTQGQGWRPIESFNATFNGNGYTISNLRIKRSDDIGVGLFFATSGRIDNLGLVNVDISGRSNVGGLAGTNSNTIMNSYATGTVSGSAAVGGLVGTNGTNATIMSSCATAAVSGLRGNQIGGLVGRSNANSTITNSCATGTVSGTSRRVGGLVGWNDGSITNSYATGSVSGSGNSVGGLVGFNFRAKITNSYATGDVIGGDSSSNVGGLVGDTLGDSPMANNYAITNSYATGSVLGGNSDIGGLIGSLDSNGMITNSYWLKEAAPMLNDIGDGSSLPYGAERTVEQLTSPTAPGTASTATYLSWSPSVWDFGSSNQFPIIRNSANDILTNNLPLCTLSIPNDVNIANDERRTVKHAMDIDKDNDGLIEVCDIEGLDEIRHQLNGMGYKTTPNATVIHTGCPGSPSRCRGFELARSLDFTDNNSYRRGTNKATYTVTTSADLGWQPIGSSFSNSFNATFNGNDYTISNLMINGRNFVGFFGYTNREAEITNLGLLKVNIIGAQRIGSFVGQNYGAIMDSYATGTVSSTIREVGGLIGRNIGIVTNSYATVNIESRGSNAGGLVGFNAVSNSKITDSYATGDVQGLGDTGGLVGENNGTIMSSYATGTVSNSGVSNPNTGGLVGKNDRIIMGSYATGTVSSSGVNVGGLVGFNAVSNSKITSSYATGKVDGGNYVGGLVGDNGGTITNSYATGNVRASGSIVGGLVGRILTDDTLNNSYWLSGSATSGGGNVPGDTEKTAEELKSPIGPGTASTTATYYNWNSDADVWDFGTSDQFPALKDSNGNLVPGQGTSITGSSLRESLRELEIPGFRTTSSQIFGVSTNNYVVTIFLREGITTDNIVLRLNAYNPDAKIQIFRDGDPTDYFAGKMSGDESLPIVVGAETKLTIRVDEPDTDYTLTFRVEELEGIQIRVKVFLEGPLQ